VRIGGVEGGPRDATFFFLFLFLSFFFFFFLKQEIRSVDLRYDSSTLTFAVHRDEFFARLHDGPSTRFASFTSERGLKLDMAKGRAGP